MQWGKEHLCGARSVKRPARVTFLAHSQCFWPTDLYLKTAEFEDKSYVCS